MSINSVASFKGSDLQSLIAAEPKNSINTAIAAKPVLPDAYEKSGSSTGKKIAWTSVALVAIATTLGVLSHKGKLFNDLITEGKVVEGFMNKAKYYVAKSGEWIANTAKSAFATVKGWLPKAKEAATETAEAAAK